MKVEDAISNYKVCFPNEEPYRSYVQTTLRFDKRAGRVGGNNFIVVYPFRGWWYYSPYKEGPLLELEERVIKTFVLTDGTNYYSDS